MAGSVVDASRRRELRQYVGLVHVAHARSDKEVGYGRRLLESEVRTEGCDDPRPHLVYIPSRTQLIHCNFDRKRQMLHEVNPSGAVEVAIPLSLLPRPLAPLAAKPVSEPQEHVADDPYWAEPFFSASPSHQFIIA